MIEPQLLVGLDYNFHLALNAGYFTFSLYGPFDFAQGKPQTKNLDSLGVTLLRQTQDWVSPI